MISGLTCACRAAGRGRSKGVLAEEGACPTLAGIRSELSSGSAGTGVRYHDRTGQKERKSDLEDGGRRRKGAHFSFVAGRRFYGVFCSCKAASLVIVSTLDWWLVWWRATWLLLLPSVGDAVFEAQRTTELVLVQRFVLEVCSSSVESSEFNSRRLSRLRIISCH